MAPRTPEQEAEIVRLLTEKGFKMEQIRDLLSGQLKQQRELNEATRDNLDTLLDAGEIHKHNLELFDAAVKAQNEFANISERIYDVTEKTSTYFEAIQKSHDAGYQAAKQQHQLMIERAAEIRDRLEQHRDATEEKHKLGEEEFKLLTERLAKLDEELIKSDEHLSVVRAVNEELKNQAAGYARIEESTDGWIKNLTGISEKGFEQSVLGSIDAVGGFSNALAASGIQMAQTFTVANVLGSGVTGIINETIRMVGLTDEATAGFYKATGASEEYGSMIRDVREESAIFGVNIGDSAAAIQTLYTQMAGFTDLSRTAKTEVANFTARMDQLGVAAGTTADLLNSGTKSLNLTSKESMTMVKDVTAAARALDIPVAQMTEDLKAAMPTLAAYGKEGVKIFKNIAAQAKQAGLATSDLLGITEQFDTFEGAAESVGRLNGILGGNYLNSLEMVNMSEDQRVRTLVQTFEMTGRNWEALDKYERKAIAASIGISDMDKANKLLGMSTEELDAKMSGADAGILSPEQMQEMADKARSFMEKLENIGQSMAVMVGPVISLINTVLEGFLWLDNVLGGMLAPTIMAVAGAWLYLRLINRAALQEEAAAAGLRLLHMGQQFAGRMDYAAFSAAVWVAERTRMGEEIVMRNATGAAALREVAIAKVRQTWANLDIINRTKSFALSTKELVINKWKAADEAIINALKWQNIKATAVSIAGKIRDIAVTVTMTAHRWAAIVSAYASLAVDKLMNAQMWKNIGLFVIQKGWLVLTTALTWGLTAAKWAMAAAAWAATSPTLLLVAALALLGYMLFVPMHSPSLFIGLGILALLLWALFPALSALTPVLYPAGLGMMFFGAGVALAGLGMLKAGIGAMFFGIAMVLVAAALVVASVALWSAVGAILALALGLTIIGLLAWMTAPGLIFLAAAIVILSSVLLSFASVSWLVLPPLFLLAIAVSLIGVSMALMFNAMSNGVGNLTGVAASLREISAAMSDMSLASVLKFVWLTEGFENMAGVAGAGEALEATADVIRSTIDVDTTKVEAVEDLVDSLSTLAIAAAISPGLAIAGALVGGMAAALSPGGEGGAGSGQDIYLVMDPSGTKVIAKAVDVQLNKMHSVYAKRS